MGREFIQCYSEKQLLSKVLHRPRLEEQHWDTTQNLKRTQKQTHFLKFELFFLLFLFFSLTNSKEMLLQTWITAGRWSQGHGSLEQFISSIARAFISPQKVLKESELGDSKWWGIKTPHRFAFDSKEKPVFIYFPSVQASYRQSIQKWDGKQQPQSQISPKNSLHTPKLPL